METFYASVVAISSLDSRIRIMAGEAWWLVSPPDRTQTLHHTSLGLKRMQFIFLLGEKTMLLLRVQYNHPLLVAKPLVVASPLTNLLFQYLGFVNQIEVRPFLQSREEWSRG